MLKELLYTGFLHGDELTVNGKTVAENLQQVAGLSELGAQVSFFFLCLDICHFDLSWVALGAGQVLFCVLELISSPLR